jgi:D-xylose 1-dehydrogenase
VNLGSIAWGLGLPELAAYAPAKAGVEGMTRSLARELGPSGIQVVCIAPGSVKTPRQLKWYPTPEAQAAILDRQSLKGRLEPHDVAALALFVASDDARFCTGQTYVVDAGWS